MGLFEAFEKEIPDDAWARERARWPEAPGQEFGLDSIREHIRQRQGYVDGMFSRMYAEEKTYEDPRLLFVLEQPFQGGMNGFLDTGVNLYAQNGDYTIFLRVRTGEQEGGSKTILSNCDNDGFGLQVLCSGHGTDEYTMFYAGEKTYEALYAQGPDGGACVAIRKQGDHYTFYGRTVSDQRNFDSPVASHIATNLVLGCRYQLHDSGAVSPHSCYTGLIERCLVYGQALEEGEIAQILDAIMQ